MEGGVGRRSLDDFKLPVIVDEPVVERVTVEEGCQAWRGSYCQSPTYVNYHPFFFWDFFLQNLGAIFSDENLGGLVAQRKHRAEQPRHDCRRRGGRGFQRRGRDQVRRSSEVSTEVAGKTGQCRARCTRMLHLTLSLSSTSTRSMAGASRNNQRQKDQRLIKTRGPKQLGILGRLTLVKPLISPYIHLIFYNKSSPKVLLC